MRNRPRGQQHNYLVEIEKALETGELVFRRGDVVILDVYHDSRCGVYVGRVCDCNPAIIQRAKGETGGER